MAESVHPGLNAIACNFNVLPNTHGTGADPLCAAINVP